MRDWRTWMWFVFTQVEGLGSSRRAREYAIGSREEAEAYLVHPTLGPRLRECNGRLNAVEGWTANEILGSPDDLKSCSPMTLSAEAADDPTPFEQALERYYHGGDASGR
jgi:uncharacterized protein (DUF1810 family)